MAQNPQEWFKQAEYDLATAKFMFRGKRYFYAVFMCHLALEKALKGVYHIKLGILPPKTHSFIFLINETGINFSKDLLKFLVNLEQANVATRYPEDILKLQKIYTATKVNRILNKTKEVLQWIKNNF
jgi:HEPN domain-containing protein